MKTYEFRKINAFSDGIYDGNGAGLVYDNNLTDEKVMQKIATDMDGFVSEVVYVRDGEEGYDFDLRYFSCECEVPFCGHGTLAAMYWIVENTPSLHEKERLIIKTSKGLLEIENRYVKEGTLYIHAPEKEVVGGSYDLVALANALNMDVSRIDESIKVVNYNAGQNSLLVPLVSAAAVIDCQPDYETLRAYCLSNDVAVMNIFSKDTVFAENDYRVRVFAPTFGYLEDTATGSANSALGYYLMDIGLWQGENLTIEQGPSRENPNMIYLSTAEGNKSQVVFGGKSAVKLEGTYYL